MQLSLEGSGERWALLGLSLALCAILIFQASESWIADRRMQSGKLALIERGAELQPGNGEAWDRVGRFWQLDFTNPDSSMAVKAYEKAVRDDPNSSYYWMDLASAYEEMGDVARAQEAFERAEAVYPASALVAWNYGNFLVRRRDYSEGYRKIRRAVATDKGLLPLAISRTWRSSEDVNVLLDDALPATPDAYLQALDFLTSNQPAGRGAGRLEAADGSGKAAGAVRRVSVSGYADRARPVRGRRARVAGSACQRRASRRVRPGESLIWNGDFSRDLANGGLDWRWSAPLGAAASFDSAPPA